MTSYRRWGIGDVGGGGGWWWGPSFRQPVPNYTIYPVSGEKERLFEDIVQVQFENYLGLGSALACRHRPVSATQSGELPLSPRHGGEG